jgi:hypothetical protein
MELGPTLEIFRVELTKPMTLEERVSYRKRNKLMSLNILLLMNVFNSKIFQVINTKNI